MPRQCSEVKLASRDYWQRFLTRAGALQKTGDARRLSKRFPFPMSGSIIFVEDDRTGQDDIAIFDVSAEGIMGLTKLEIPWHVEVRIELDPEGTPFALRGHAMHCTPTVDGYKVGVQLTFVAQT